MTIIVDVFSDHFIKSKRKKQLAVSTLKPEQNPLDKALKEIVEKIDEAEKTCEKLMIPIKKSRILKEQLHKVCLKKHALEKLEKNNDELKIGTEL